MTEESQVAGRYTIEHSLRQSIVSLALSALRSDESERARLYGVLLVVARELDEYLRSTNGRRSGTAKEDTGGDNEQPRTREGTHKGYP